VLLIVAGLALTYPTWVGDVVGIVLVLGRRRDAAAAAAAAAGLREIGSASPQPGEADPGALPA
jgi:UPF0716 family protein affecting phage T7 exclusion